MTDKKGAEKKERSFILIEFPEVGAADFNVIPTNVTPGQVQAAAFFLNVYAERGIHEMLSAQQAKAMQEQALMQSIIKSGKLKQ